MQFRINIKPKKYLKTSPLATNMFAPASSTKQDVIKHIFRNFTYVYSNNCACYVNHKIKMARVASFQKVRKKVEIVTDTRLIKKGIKRKLITPTHWVATYYDIPVSLLEMMQVKAVQKWNTWELVALE